MDAVDFLVILAILALLGVTFAFSGKWKLLIKKPEMKLDDEAKLSVKEANQINAIKAEMMVNASSDDEDKVLCSFCESYVEIPENGLCPNCGASLSEAIQADKEKKAMMQVELLRIQSEMENDRLKAERTTKLVETAAITAASVVSPFVGRRIVKNIIKNRKK